MDALLKDLGTTFSGFVESTPVRVSLNFIIAYVILLWLVAAFWAYRDLRSRTENPFLPFVAAGFILVFTPILFPFAVGLYRVARPPERLGEAHERMLAEEALLAEVESVPHCPGCGRRTNDEWIICPSCRTRLSRVCPSCSRHVGLDWSICAWCGKDFEHLEGMARTSLPVSAPPQVSVAPTPSLRSRFEPGRLAGAEADAATATPMLSADAVGARTDALMKSAGSSLRALRSSVTKAAATGGSAPEPVDEALAEPRTKERPKRT